ncbi:hypothetical protein C0J52_26420 [Blattella germanica]|nr:hypothetical protein C0J52_26420 [Blattella germanica]
MKLLAVLKDRETVLRNNSLRKRGIGHGLKYVLRNVAKSPLALRCEVLPSAVADSRLSLAPIGAASLAPRSPHPLTHLIFLFLRGISTLLPTFRVPSYQELPT